MRIFRRPRNQSVIFIANVFFVAKARRGCRFSYSHRLRFLAPISTRVKVGLYRCEWCNRIVPRCRCEWPKPGEVQP